LRYVPTGIDTDDLIPGITDIVRGQLQPPIPNINPTAESNGIVNLGMWLAVEPQTLPPITAQAGPTTWITVTPTLTSTTYDFGNGDTTTCDGTGIPIRDVHPDLDVIEQSPTCGYTYRLSSPEDEPYQLTITTTWELPYTSSSGPGEIPPLDRSLTIDYDVDEIQTLGTNG
jgi:enoyl reductase